MYKSAFSKLYWGFFFILIDFTIQGFDIFPDIIGYIFLAAGLSVLAENNEFFVKASKFNIPMILISVFTIYVKPVHSPGINFGSLGVWGIPIMITALALNLLVAYYIFMGIKHMAQSGEQPDIYEEADKMWNHYLLLQLAVILVFVLVFIPPLAVAYVFVLFIASIAYAAALLRFIKKCGECF